MNAVQNGWPPLPHWPNGIVAIEAPGREPGNWAGGPSAATADGGIYLAYRLRRPVGQGRGFALVVARSDDGERFETAVELHRDDFETDSFERPALVRLAGGRWRLYVSCATPDTLHWRIDVLEADKVEDFDPSQRRPLLAGDENTAFKDPVVVRDGDEWHMWACCHDIAVPADADRMYSVYGTSPGGLDWTWHGTALAGRPGEWDQRGARITSVLLDHKGGPAIAYYDGRADAGNNWEEMTGIARGTRGAPPDRFTADADGPAAVSPQPPGGLRYLSVLALSEGGYRLYYEATGADGAHDLRTEYVPPSR